MKIVEHIEAVAREIGVVDPNDFDHLCVVDCILGDIGIAAQLVWKDFSGPGDRSARLFAMHIENRLWDLSGYTNWDDLLQKHLTATNPLSAKLDRWRGSTTPILGGNPFSNPHTAAFMTPRQIDDYHALLALYQQKIMTLSTDSAPSSRPSSSPRL